MQNLCEQMFEDCTLYHGQKVIASAVVGGHVFFDDVYTNFRCHQTLFYSTPCCWQLNSMKNTVASGNSCVGVIWNEVCIVSFEIWWWSLGQVLHVDQHVCVTTWLFKPYNARAWANDRIEHVLTTMSQTCGCICMSNCWRLLGLSLTLLGWGFCKVRQ